MFKKRSHKTERGFFAKHKFWMGVATMVGTIIGAGILAIPYVISKSGFWYGLLVTLLIGLAFLVLNLYVGEIVLRTKEQHQLTGYMDKYLGKWGRYLMMASMMIGIYGAMTAYLIGEGETFRTIIGFGNPLAYSLIFFAIVSLIIYLGIKATGKTELILISLLVLIVVLIGIFSFDKIEPVHFTKFNPVYFFLPYGVILFAFLGSVAMPEVQEVLGNKKNQMKKVIVLGSLIPIIIYLVFTLVVSGIVGLDSFEALSPNERIATIALSAFSHPILGFLANLLAVLAMFTSFLTLGIALVEMYNYDFKIPRWISLLLTLSVPLILTVTNLTTFIAVIGLAGVFAGGIDGIIVVLAYWKAKKLGNRRPEFSLNLPRFVGWIIMIMFAIGVIYQFWDKFF